ncbi:transcription factor bHLH120-like isoform X3 [Hevea brasiliensis]|uniref:transcription factor bHLH120-like isoform X3 n=1 Tax=Hevea brasiliensis TaxID=3981 RepID=UPI0025D9F5BD|nr:transcription factor bHLH120-like isoform X3 [Hevea brasiliensis]
MKLIILAMRRRSFARRSNGKEGNKCLLFMDRFDPSFLLNHSRFSLMGLQGKRSMSDHLNAAAKYIKNLQNNVQELSVKRDMLKNLSDSSTSLDDQGTEISSQNNFMNTIVTVRSHVGGVEIGVSCGSGENSFPLSRVLEAVVEEGFDVVSCISTKRDGRLYSTIQCQASHLTCIDVAELQQKLNDGIDGGKRII